MNHCVNLTPVSQYKVDILGFTKSDARNTWEGVVETSLAMHASKFVRTGLAKGKRKNGRPQRKSHSQNV